MTCPICIDKLQNTSASDEVCDKHASWFIVHCQHCGKMVFAEQTRFCNRCAASLPGRKLPLGGFASDHRWALRINGQDDWRNP